MKASQTLLNIEKSIKKYNPKHYTCVITLPNMSHPVLLTATNSTSRKIRIYDESNGINSIAIIRYSLNGKNLFISELEVNTKYQRLGIGSFLLETAIAHGDILGATTAYGHAFPTNEIKGTSHRGYGAEVAALVRFYKSAGCDIRDLNENSTKAFTQTWTSGDKIDNAQLKAKIIAESIAEYETVELKNLRTNDIDISTSNLL